MGKDWRISPWVITLGMTILISSGCSKDINREREVEKQYKENQIVRGEETMENNNEMKLETEFSTFFENIKLADTLKEVGTTNPVMTQRFGADPYAIVYEGRVYIYMTGDVLEYDQNNQVSNNTFGRINSINVISSDDLINWTDHGSIYIGGIKGVSLWGNNSWAPAVAYKEIDGKTKFFLYFANGGNGIGVLTADSPVGPFIDPLQKSLISRETPNCREVAWLFDPAVLVDDDGRAYLYFGGGVPEGKEANPGTARVVELGEDMISIIGEPIALEVPYLFEDSGINKIGDTYYYTYCSNWNVAPEDVKKLGFGNAEIIYMTSDQPMGPFTLRGSILKNPGQFFGCYGTNHHCLFEFNDQWYITYHTQILEEKLGIAGGYRSTHIDRMSVNDDGSINPINGTKRGMTSVKNLNPYEKVEAETMVTMGGISTIQCGETSTYCGSGNMAICDIQTGDWIQVAGVDFKDKGAKSFTAAIKSLEKQTGIIQMRIDSLEGEVIGYLKVQADEDREYKEISAELLSQVVGVHDLFFIFYGEGYEIDYWYFN